MTREETEKMLPIMQAYAEGKTVQYKNREGEWIDLDIPKFEYLTEAKVRIKPESFARPFHDAEECWQEMQKHQPLGWLRYDGLDSMIHISYLRDEALTLEGGCLYTFENAFDKGYAFADGAPFGIIEEGQL